MAIRKARPADFKGIIRALGSFNFKLLNAVDSSAVDDLWPGTFVLRNEVTEIDLKNGFVALSGNKIVGFCHYKRYKPGVVKTTLLAVLPEYRKHGFGKALQVARMKEAYRRGYKKMMTWSEHPDSQRWYKKHFGYKKVGVEPVSHRLYFFRLRDKIIWGIHYGFPEFKAQESLVCDLKRFLDEQ